MTSVLSAFLAILQTIAPTATETAIAQIITALTNVIPFLINEYKALSPIVKNIIAALKDNGNVTDDQMTQLQSLDAQTDAAFEAAATAAQAEDSSN